MPNYTKQKKYLAETHPHLVKDLVNPDDAKTVTFGSHKKLLWKCDKGHVYEQSVCKHVIGRRCAICAGQKIVHGINDLATVNPKLAQELVDKSLATKIGAHDSHPVEWECAKGHRWFASVSSRNDRHYGCSYCSGRYPIVGESDLCTTHPELSNQLVDKSLGTKLKAGSNRMVEWKCANGHVWKARVADRAKGRGCPFCSGFQVLKGFNSLWDTHKELAKELVNPHDGYTVSKGSESYLEWKCSACGAVWVTKVNNRTHGGGCPKCRKNGTSQSEKELLNYVQSIYSGEVVANDRSVLDGMEIDIYIPDLKIGIEYNGLYWHSEMYRKQNYHYEKFKLAKDKGVKLFQIFEDDWLRKKDVCENTIRHKLGLDNRIYARKTQCEIVSPREAKMFYDEHHMQGSVGATWHFGLYHNGELVACMSFTKCKGGRTHRLETDAELVRFASKNLVVGGASKLLTHAEKFLKECGIKRIISFSDNCISDGGLYETLGFELDAELEPDYKYFGSITNDIRKPKQAFQKRKFKENPNLLYEEGLTERELAELNGLTRIYDAGKIRWVKEL